MFVLVPGIKRDSVNQMGPLFSILKAKAYLLGLLLSKFGLNYMSAAGWVVGMIKKTTLEQLLPTHPPDLNPFAIGSFRLSASKALMVL